MSAWALTTIREVAAVSGGLTKNARRDLLPERVPYLTVANVYANRLELDDVGTIGIQGSELARVALQPGDLLLVEGNGSLSQLGRVAVWRGEIEGCVHQNHLIKLRPTAKVTSRWLLYWLMSHEGRAAIERVGSSTSGLHTLSISKVEGLPVRVCPLLEQERIIAEIETQFSRLDATEARLNRALVNLKRARASVLKAAVEGRLVPTEADLARSQCRSYEPSAITLARILTERQRKQAQLGLKGLRRGEEAEEARDLPSLPDGWCWTSLASLASDQERSIQSGPFGSNLLHSEFQTTGKLVIGIDNVQDGFFSPGAQHRISEQKFKDLEQYQARPEDVLITVMATVGRCCVIPQSIEQAIITKHVYRITCEQRLVSPYYLMYMLNGAPPVRTQMFGSVRGQTRPGLNGTLVKQLDIPLPPLAEQHRIVAEVDRRLSVLDRLEARLTANLSRCKRLRQAILKRAFEGRLVPQDPP